MLKHQRSLHHEEEPCVEGLALGLPAKDEDPGLRDAVVVRDRRGDARGEAASAAMRQGLGPAGALDGIPKLPCADSVDVTTDQ